MLHSVTIRSRNSVTRKQRANKDPSILGPTIRGHVHFKKREASTLSNVVQGNFTQVSQIIKHFRRIISLYLLSAFYATCL